MLQLLINFLEMNKKNHRSSMIYFIDLLQSPIFGSLIWGSIFKEKHSNPGHRFVTQVTVGNLGKTVTCSNSLIIFYNWGSDISLNFHNFV